MPEMNIILRVMCRQEEPCQAGGTNSCKIKCNPAFPTPPFGLVKLAVADPITKPRRAQVRLRSKAKSPLQIVDVSLSRPAPHRIGDRR